MSVYTTLMAAASEYHENHPLLSMQQVIAMMTEEGRVRVFVNDLSEVSERAILAAQQEPIRAMLVRWPNGALDVPSHHLCQGLLDSFPENGDADVFLLMGSDCPPELFSIGARKLSHLK